MRRLIIITYESYKREAIQYSIEALEYIISNYDWIIEVEIVEMNNLKKMPPILEAKNEEV